MNEEKKFQIPEALIVFFDGDIDTIGESSGDLSIFDPDDPQFPGF